MALIDKRSEKKLVTLKELEVMPTNERIQYFSSIRATCANRHVPKQTNSAIMRWLGRIASKLRKYDFEISDYNNIPSDENVIFVCNHSNAHDYFTIFETFYLLKKKVSTFGAYDGLNWYSRLFARLGNSILFIRNDEKSKEKGILDFCSKIINGDNGFIFGEGTWNMHPTRPMQNIHAGVTEIALITDKKVVPVIFEYAEHEDDCKKEKDIYKKVLVSFGKPIIVSLNRGIFEQTDEIQKTMEQMRTSIWKKEGIRKEQLSAYDIDRYIKHTYLKKFKAFGFKYNTVLESQFLLGKGQIIENEYCKNSNGEFVPGIIEKKPQKAVGVVVSIVSVLLAGAVFLFGDNIVGRMSPNRSAEVSYASVETEYNENVNTTNIIVQSNNMETTSDTDFDSSMEVNENVIDENIAEEDTDELKTPWSIIRNVTLINNNEMENTMTFSVTADYYFPDEEYAKMAVHANYMDDSSWTGVGVSAEKLITKGAGTETFVFDLVIPEQRDQLGFKIYIHPYPIPEGTWDPLFVSEEAPFPIR